jgi:predicted MPP superfamily phosphohydrolase
MLAVALLAIGALLVVGYAWIEAGWLRCRVLEVPIDGLPEALDGVRIGHLSDFHFGAALSRGNQAGVRAIRWIAERKPDIVCITGDLVSHPRGERCLRGLVASLSEPFVVLGNHDVAVTRDPFSRAAELEDLGQARVLADRAHSIALHGERITVVGVDPVTYRARRGISEQLAADRSGLRLLLCHFPRIVDRLPPASFDLILAGHLHAGQICIPIPGRRITLAHPRAKLVSGLYSTPAGTLHVSPGTGTTFVPFRLFSRPEVTELVLRRP